MYTKTIITHLICMTTAITAYSQETSKSTVGEKVIAHYTKTGDQEKIKAARFIAENMKYHSFKDSPILDKYYAGIEQINKQYKYPECTEQYYRLYTECGDPYVNLTLTKDNDFINEKDIINNIDMAFEDWRNGLWAKHLSFEDFCEYMLPYRVNNEKPTSNWREDLRKLYYKYATSVITSDDMKNSAFWAASKVNDALKALKYNNKKVLPELNINLPVSALKNMQMGECIDYATYTTYVMRACGIPVCLDYTPQWPNRSNNHYWNSLLDNTGLNIPFMGCESNPGYPNKQGREMAKVYRRTFSYQPQSLYALNKDLGENIPPILNTPFIKDVSNEYFIGKNITTKLNDKHLKDKFAYIAVFNNQTWIPVDFAVINSNRTATFKNLGSNIVYLPVFWGRNGCIPAGDPILLNRDGSIVYLKPNHNKKQSIIINRKYPHFNRIVRFRGIMKKGYFEAANNPNFSDAKQCATIKKTHLIGYDTLTVTNIKGKYRYWRFVSPEKGRCNVAEIAFLKNGIKQSFSNIISDSKGQNKTKPEYAFDGKEVTYYESTSPKDAWIGVDMGHPVEIDKIAYLPRNDANDIVIGHTYQLCYFENGKQKIADTQIAKNGTLVFKDIPSETIYILHDLNEGQEERIFTYNNNKINWY